MVIYPYGETVTVLDGVPVTQDSYGNDVPAWPLKGTYSGVPVAPADANGTGGNEFLDGRDTVIIGLTVYLPDGADITPVDRMVVRGQTWEVVGQPQAWLNPYTGRRPGIPVALRRVEG